MYPAPIGKYNSREQAPDAGVGVICERKPYRALRKVTLAKATWKLHLRAPPNKNKAITNQTPNGPRSWML